MSNYDFILGNKSHVRDAVMQSSQVASLFPDARWELIGVDKKLTEFLINSFDHAFLLPDVSADEYATHQSYRIAIERLKVSIKQRVIILRGETGLKLQSVFGMPAVYPEDIYQHQFFNLIERLYLSSFYNSNKEPMFGSDLMSRETWETKMGAINLLTLGFPVLGIGGSVWIIKRRNKLRMATSLGE